MQNIKLIIKFQNMVIDRSESSKWPEAKWEWVRKGQKQKGHEKCLSGRNIRNLFFVKNRKTRITMPLGRGCLNKMFKVESIVDVTLEQRDAGSTGKLLIT